MSDKESIQRMVAFASESLGGLDVLFAKKIGKAFDRTLLGQVAEGCRAIGRAPRHQDATATKDKGEELCTTE